MGLVELVEALVANQQTRTRKPSGIFHLYFFQKTLQR
jgi:hypothetical protein